MQALALVGLLLLQPPSPTVLGPGVLAGFGAQGQAPAPKKFKDVEKLLPAYFLSTGKAREAVLERMKKAGLDGIVLTKKECDFVERLALAGNTTAVGPKKGDYAIDVEIGGGKKAAVHVHVPGGYKGQAAPLLVVLHGGSAEIATYEGAKRVAQQELSYYTGPCDTAKAFCVAPSTSVMWNEKAGLEAIWKAIEHVRDNYNVDPNRIGVSGHSMGGFGIFEIAPTYAERFALAAPFVGGADAGPKLRNCRALPFYIVVGLKDPMQYIVEGCRKNAKALAEWKYDVTFKERADQGHDVIADEFPAVMDKLAKSPRNLYAKKLTRTGGTGRWYWVEADGAVEADVAGQTIELSGTGTVFLSDRLVDLDKPVTVKVGGEVKFEGRVDRSLAFLLKHLDESQDRGRVFANRVEVK